MKNVKYGKCVRCGKTYEATPDLTNCQCGGILDIVYDYDYIKSVLTKEKLARRENRSMWRYRELLPVEETTPDTPLRVGWSPLYDEPNLARALGIRKLWVKDDGQNPTASLKDRASAMAVAKAYEAGAKTIACSSTGNAASSLAGNAAAAGFKTYIFVPERAPKGKVAQLMIFGANVISVKGNYEETFKMSAEAIEKYGWYNRNAAINPYLSEGKKTVALEIAEQLNWEMPDYLAISVGDGCTMPACGRASRICMPSASSTSCPGSSPPSPTAAIPSTGPFRRISRGSRWRRTPLPTPSPWVYPATPTRHWRPFGSPRALLSASPTRRSWRRSGCWAAPAACSVSLPVSPVRQR